MTVSFNAALHGSDSQSRIPTLTGQDWESPLGRYAYAVSSILPKDLAKQFDRICTSAFVI